MTVYLDKKLETKLILPFADSTQNRITTFTRDMEMATILYLAESNRTKGEGRILKKPDEKLVFITEAFYPIWLVPWNEQTLLFDGLGATAHTLSYESLPDINAFNNDIQSTRTRETYSVALSRNANHFENFEDTQEKTIQGLITSPDLLKDFLVYIAQMQEPEKPLTPNMFLSPTINEPEISASLNDLSELSTKIDNDVKNIEASMKLLSITTKEKVRTAREEIKKSLRNFDKQIEKAKARASEEAHQIQEKYDRNITRISTQFERQLKHLRRDHILFERKIRNLRTEINRCEAKIRSCKLRKRKRNENQWTQKCKKIKKRLPAIEKSIRELDKKIKKLETAQKQEIASERTECETHIEETTKILKELEASREAEISTKQQEIASLQNTTSSILNQINEMAKAKKAALNEFDSIGMPKWNRIIKLVYLPFYLVRYEMEAKTRYIVYPPSIVNDMDMLTKMKGALGGAKMKTFLQPRSQAITAFLNQFITLIQKNPTLEKEITDAGIQDSILQTRKLRISVKRGLEELRDQKWMSENELQTLSKLLYIYA